MQVYKNKSFISKQDGLEIFYDVYMPEVSNATLIQIAHGMVEHKDRYEWVGSYLAERGFIVVINDHRGHGKSIDTLHPWGEMNGLDSKSSQNAESSGFVKAIMDMHQLTLLAKEHFKPQKYVLLGHSMGSLLARGYVKTYRHELDSLILSGSPAYNPFVRVGASLARILQMCGLEIRGKKWINALSFGGFNKPFLHNVGEDNTKGGFAWLCRDRAVVEAYKADSACQFVFSLESFIGLFKGMAWVNKVNANQANMGQNLPLLIISGNKDSCGNFGIGVEKIANQYRLWGFDVRLKLYEGARHEILNETNKQEVIEDIVEFVGKNV
ncbi:alpha/beta hydrolase [Helicobacter cinaedi]|uniref:alpha/beta fold hydrolase n=1 Tax=Helicobacter cinaedi TaxID=213 RepID=UPI001F2896CB|nr:alpha/beta hydrolase [Helicobacter cinaedi]BDB64266.1 alpha/beta hydrolase [Helicobacter cinaedi]